MSAETTLVEKQTEQLKQEVALLTQQVELLKAKSALSSAQAQLPFAELEGIKAATSGLTMPAGKEGTVKVSAGTTGTALLRSKKAMLEVLDAAANDLIKICPAGAAILSEAQLGQALSAQFTLKRIADETSVLATATNKAKPTLKDVVGQEKSTSLEGVVDQEKSLPALGPFVAGAYTAGFALDTINSLAKLLRTNRQFDVFDADKEEIQMLGYLLEAKDKGFLANPGLLGDKAMEEAEKLLTQLNSLATNLQMAKDTMTIIQKNPDILAKAPANAQINMPTDEDINKLKVEIDNAISLLESLHPSKKSDAFWAQVNGQVLAANIQNKKRLFLEAKAQTIQITESRWYTSDRILATGEVQVAYRFVKPDGSVEKSGVILKASKSDTSRIDELTELNWYRP